MTDIDTIAEQSAQEEVLLHLPDLHDHLYPDNFKPYAQAPKFPADEWLADVADNDLFAFVFIGSNRQKLLAIEEIKARYLKKNAQLIAHRAGSIAWEMTHERKEDEKAGDPFGINRRSMFEGMDDMMNYGGTQ